MMPVRPHATSISIYNIPPPHSYTTRTERFLSKPTNKNSPLHKSESITAMGNSLRCCLACVIPCGALDVIRIVHLNGDVDEITHPVTAGEVLKANPNHVLTTPSSEGLVRQILLLSPTSELKRGGIYFLVPSSFPAQKKKDHHHRSHSHHRKAMKSPTSKKSNGIVSGQEEPCFLDIVEGLKTTSSSSSRRDRRHSHSRPGSWQPHLQSILEN